MKINTFFAGSRLLLTTTYFIKFVFHVSFCLVIRDLPYIASNSILGSVKYIWSLIKCWKYDNNVTNCLELHGFYQNLCFND